MTVRCARTHTQKGWPNVVELQRRQSKSFLKIHLYVMKCDLVTKQKWETNLQTKLSLTRWEKDYSSLAANNTSTFKKNYFLILNILLNEKIKQQNTFWHIFRPIANSSHAHTGNRDVCKQCYSGNTTAGCLYKTLWYLNSNHLIGSNEEPDCQQMCPTWLQVSFAAASSSLSTSFPPSHWPQPTCDACLSSSLNQTLDLASLVRTQRNDKNMQKKIFVGVQQVHLL